MPACALGLQKHLFRYSLKMPTCMIIFKILFSQKHYIVLIFKWSHLDTNLWIWNLCICQKHANRSPAFGNGFGIHKRLQKAVQVSSILPWTSQGKNICFTELFVTILKRVVKWAKNNLLQHIPAFVFILKWEKKTSSHFEIISFINIYNKNPPKRMKWWWKRNLALNNEMRMNEMKTKPCI